MICFIYLKQFRQKLVNILSYLVIKLWLAQGFTGLPYFGLPLLKQVMPGGQVEVLHSQDNGYFYIPLASIITAVMFAPKVVATKFSIHLAKPIHSTKCKYFL